jgi:hypothetical protein
MVVWVYVLCVFTKKSIFQYVHCRYQFLIVRSTARHAITLQLDISANALEIRVVQSPKCIVWCVVDCTSFAKT